MSSTKINEKLFLSEVRDGDYTHPGSELPIDLMLQGIKINENSILDMGCGLGGTLQYIYENYSHPTCYGVDIDYNNIVYAKQKYHMQQFIEADAHDLSCFYKQNNKILFDIIVSMCAFYAFYDHKKAFSEISHILNDYGQVIIFDYTIKGSKLESDPFDDGDNHLFNPLNLTTLSNELKEAVLCISKHTDITDKFINWYNNIIKEMKNHKTEYTVAKQQIILNFTRLLDLLENDKLFSSILIINKC